MNQFNLNEAVSLFNEQTGALNSLWSFYAVVAFGLLGFTYRGIKIRGESSLRITLSIGFILFSWANWTAMRRTQDILSSVVSGIHQVLRDENAAGLIAPPFRTTLEKFEVTPVPKVFWFHLLLDVGVLLGMWLPNIVALIRPNKRVNATREQRAS